MLYLNPVILTKLEKETSWLQAPTAWGCHPPGCRTRTTLKNIPNHPETLTVDTELGCGVWPKLSKVFWRERDSCMWNSYNQTWKRQLKAKQLQPNMKETAESETATTKHERDSWKWNSYNQTCLQQPLSETSPDVSSDSSEIVTLRDTWNKWKAITRTTWKKLF